MIWDVAVIGAGMAGLSCARHLQQQGHRILVLDKSRGVGGRLATRRIQTTWVDHGCRYLEASSPAMADLIEQLRQAQILRRWSPQVGQLNAQGQLTLASPQQPFWVAPQGMTAIAKWLAQPLEVYLRSPVKAISPTPDHHWQITIDGAIDPTNSPVVARALVLALPAPQAATLLQASALDRAWEACLVQLGRAVYAPCITVMAGYDGDLEPTWNREDRVQAEGWMVVGHPQSAIAWIGLDSAKRTPGAPTSLVLQSSAAFAQPWLDTAIADLAVAAQDLLTAASPHVMADLQGYQWLQIHRWRYASVQQSALAPPAPASTDGPPLVFAGDWTQGKTAAAALESGLNAARDIQTRL